MNLIILKDLDFIDNRVVRIKGRRFKHLCTVNQVNSGSRLACGLLNGKTGTGVITKISDTFLDMEICLKNNPPVPLPLTLVLSLPRPKVVRRIIESVTTLGVKKIYLINSWRVEKSYWQSPLLDKKNLEQYMILGLEQSCDTILPHIYKKRFFTTFVKEELPLISQDSLCLAAHPGATRRCPSGINCKTTLVIGPEGGLIDKEVETLEDIGFKICNIGQRVLRVETAVTYLIAKLFS